MISQSAKAAAELANGVRSSEQVATTLGLLATSSLAIFQVLRVAKPGRRYRRWAPPISRAEVRRWH